MALPGGGNPGLSPGVCWALSWGEGCAGPGRLPAAGRLSRPPQTPACPGRAAARRPTGLGDPGQALQGGILWPIRGAKREHFLTLKASPTPPHPRPKVLSPQRKILGEFDWGAG